MIILVKSLYIDCQKSILHNSCSLLYCIHIYGVACVFPFPVHNGIEDVRIHG